MLSDLAKGSYGATCLQGLDLLQLKLYFNMPPFDADSADDCSFGPRVRHLTLCRLCLQSGDARCAKARLLEKILELQEVLPSILSLLLVHRGAGTCCVDVLSSVLPGQAGIVQNPYTIVRGCGGPIRGKLAYQMWNWGRWNLGREH